MVQRKKKPLRKTKKQHIKGLKVAAGKAPNKKQKKSAKKAKSILDTIAPLTCKV